MSQTGTAVTVRSVRALIVHIFIVVFVIMMGARGGAVVEALRYKPEGRGIDFRWCHWNFSLT
jgi:hypothetical protein